MIHAINDVLVIQEKLKDNGVFLYPTFNSARYHHASFLSPFSFGYWAIFNVLKVPVCQVPMGLDENGLPVGVQVRWLLSLLMFVECC